MKGFMVALACVLLLVFGAIAAACGPDGEQLTLEEYFRRSQTLVDDQGKRSSPVETKLVENLESATSLEEQVEASRAFFSFALSEIEEFIQNLRDLDPPAEVEDAHNQMADGFQEVAVFTENLIDQLNGVDSEAALTALFTDYVSVFEPLEAPCRALEEIADDNGIEIDLDCESVEND